MSSIVDENVTSCEDEIFGSDSEGDLIIDETLGSADDSFVQRRLTAKPRRRVTVISDSEDEEDEQFERRALSPRTRMSITGVRPSDLSDDSSEIEYTSADETEKNSFLRHEAIEKNYENSEAETEIENESSSHVSDKQGESPKISQIGKYTNPPDISYKQTSPPLTSPKLPDYNTSVTRYSTVFEHSIEDKLSSTIYQEKGNDSDKSSSDSDLVMLTHKGSVVDISSDDIDSPSNNNHVNPALIKPKLKKIIQPKISTALSRTPSSSKHVTAKKFVSQDFYNKEVQKLDELKSDLVSAENLYEKLGASLYDGGKQLSLRVDSLKRSVKKKAEEIVNFVIEDSKPKMATVTEQSKKSFFNSDAPNWDDLSEAVNKIKPAFTGKQGLNTFNKQKVLTIERLKDLHGSLETCPSDDVLADDPKGLKLTLMKHQKHALAWMYWRERQKPRGGILADDMGLGKTLTMISLVLSFKNKEEDQTQVNDESDGEDEKENQGWSTKNRRDYYKGGTLVVCPASLMRQWENEVENKVARHKLSVCVHHGNNRDTKPRHLSTYDIVITTYNIVSREAKSQGAIFSINWRRIILDEAHVIRNHKSLSSVAVCELRGKFRWVLTGTPIQNKEMDVYALLKFLKCTPFDDLSHWKKWIDNKSAGGQQRLNTLIKSLMLRRTKSQLQQQGSLMCLPERDCKLIEVNLDKDEMNVYQKIMTYSKSLFAQFLYQRAEKNSDLYYNDQGQRPTFMKTKDPNGAYHKMHQKFSKMHHGGKEIKSHEILVLLLRLRQICCHPGLIDAMLEDEDENALSNSDSIEPEIDLLDQLNKLAISDKSGSSSLLSDSLNDDGQHEAISKASAKVLQRSNPVFDLSRPSSKMNKVLQIVEEQILSCSDKGIIISQWTSILNILKNHLESKGVCTLSLNGTIPVKNRQSIVTEFNDPNTKPKILLLSLTAGGVGLNLVGANHLLLIDLHWNPQLESQAQDRIYRVGQKKPVHIYKFMCKDTVEERIKSLQDQKLQIANGLLTGVKASEGSKLSIDDLKGLFGL